VTECISSAIGRWVAFIALAACLLVSSAAVAADGVWKPLPSVHTVEPLPGRLEFLVDQTAKLSINDLLAGKGGAFSPVVGKDLKFPTRDGAVWVRFAGDFSQYSLTHWFLIQNYEHEAVMDVFYPDGGGYKKDELSESLSIARKPISVHNYLFKIPAPLGIATYYIRYLPEGHDVIVDLAWSSEAGLVTFLARTNLEEGLFFGGLLVMWAYNLFLLVYLREKTYLFYIYYLGAFIGTFAYIDGFMPAIVGMSVLKEQIFATFPFFALNGMIVFGRTFLNIRETKSFLNRYLWLAQQIALVAAVSPFVLPRGHSFELANVLIILVLPVLFAAGIFQMLNGYRPARYYFLGWSVFAVALCLLALKSLLIIPESWLTDYAVKFAAVWEAVVFSFALAFRLRFSDLLIKQRVALAMDELKDALEREKLAVKKNVQFIAAVNHELRSPLQRLINGYDTVAAASGFGDADPRLVNLRRIANQIVTQMKDIGEFSRLEAAVLELRQGIFCINDVMSGMEEDFGEDIREKNVVLQIEIENGSDLVIGDRDRIRQVFSNLIQNAVKFTETGRVDVHCMMQVSAPGEPLSLRDTPPALQQHTVQDLNLVSPGHLCDSVEVGQDRTIEFSVSDTGRGIPVEDLNMVFEPFWQGKTTEKQLGSGLGLAIVKRLTDLLGGSVSVESTVGVGSTFTVKFPVRVSSSAK